MNENILQCSGFYPREQKGNQNTCFRPSRYGRQVFVCPLFFISFGCLWLSTVLWKLDKKFLAVEGIMLDLTSFTDKSTEFCLLNRSSS